MYARNTDEIKLMERSDLFCGDLRLSTIEIYRCLNRIIIIRRIKVKLN